MEIGRQFACPGRDEAVHDCFGSHEVVTSLFQTMRHASRNNLPRQCASANALALAKSLRRVRSSGKRSGDRSPVRNGPFLPSEIWYEPSSQGTDCYRIISEAPGEGYVHVVNEADVRDRLSQLPDWMLGPLEIVQLSRMTRKKRLFPCYGMQWGPSLYLYPIEESLTETYDRAPKSAVFIEAQMFGGRWEQLEGTHWRLHWTLPAVRDFYLNNILIHELGHLLDDRNRSSVDRERFAEWFAIEYGYRATKSDRQTRLGSRRLVRRRHHAK